MTTNIDETTNKYRSMCIRDLVQNFTKVKSCKDDAITPINFESSDTIPEKFVEICKFTNESSAIPDKDIACKKCKALYRHNPHNKKGGLYSLESNPELRVTRENFQCRNEICTGMASIKACNHTAYCHPIRDSSLISYMKNAKWVIEGMPQTENMTALEFAMQNKEAVVLHAKNRFSDLQKKENSASKKHQHIIKPSMMKFFYFLRTILKVDQDLENDNEETCSTWTSYCPLCNCGHESCHDKLFGCHEKVSTILFKFENGELKQEKKEISRCLNRTNRCCGCEKAFPICHFNMQLQLLREKPDLCVENWSQSKLYCNMCFSKDEMCAMSRTSKLLEGRNAKKPKKRRTFKRNLSRASISLSSMGDLEEKERAAKKAKTSCITKKIENKALEYVDFSNFDDSPKKMVETLNLMKDKLRKMLNDLNEIKENMPAEELRKLNELHCSLQKSDRAKMDDPCAERVSSIDTERAQYYSKTLRHILKNDETSKIFGKIEFCFGATGGPSFRRVRKPVFTDEISLQQKETQQEIYKNFLSAAEADSRLNNLYHSDSDDHYNEFEGHQNDNSDVEDVPPQKNLWSEMENLTQ